MRRAAPLLLALGIAGCAVDVGAPRAPAAQPPPSTAERLLASLGRLRALDEAALAAEVRRARQSAEGAPDDFARVEAAMALSLAPAADEAEVLALVAPLLREEAPASAELRAMAGFLQGQAIERRKLRDAAATAQAKAREDRREAQSQRTRADAQQERADQLQLKLDALTNLEKSLSKRRPANDPNRRPR